MLNIDEKNLKDCKYGFPFKPRIEEKIMYKPETKRWEYYMPRHKDRNVVPYP